MKPEVIMPEGMMSEILMPEAAMIEAAAKTALMETRIDRPDAYTNAALRLNGLRQRGHSKNKSGGQARQ